VRALTAVTAADAIILATPIYNYDANAVAKNFVELTGKGWENKVVAFLCVAGGEKSFMSVMPLANSLMLDFRCVIVPRFVYATGAAFTGDQVTAPDIVARVAQCARATVRLAAAVKAAG
jgi:FMN reductase